jgi:phenylalanyl-tRNA synthetase beta subunit
MKDVFKLMRCFPQSFINYNNELILERTHNVYFRLEDVETKADLICKLLAWVSRPAHNEFTKPKIRKFLRDSVNEYLSTNFSANDFRKIYNRLGNEVKRSLTIKFIASNYDMEVLERN